MNTSPSPEHLAEVVQSVDAEIKNDLDMIRDIALDFESAAIAVSELKGKQQRDLDGTTVYSGWHPRYGNIQIVMPPAGNGLLLLPFVFRDF